MNANNLSKLISLMLTLILCVSAMTACTVEPAPNTPPEENVTDPNEVKYTDALALLEKGDYDGAFSLFTELGDYKDAVKLAARFHYVPTTVTDKYVEADGEIIENGTHTYNDKNLPATCVYVDGDYRHTCPYTYNDSCKVTKIHCTDTDGIEEYMEYEYDANGNLVGEVKVFEDGSTYSYEYTYNDNGYMTTMVSVIDEGTRYLSEYTYDENGNEILAVTTFNGMSVRYESVYDDKGNKTAEYHKDENGNEIAKYVYTYDEKGRNTSEIHFVMGEESSHYEYTYDHNGQLIREHFDYGEGDYITYEYTYDDNGNIVKAYRINADNEERTRDVAFKLTYIPYDLTSEEWENIMDYVLGW